MMPSIASPLGRSGSDPAPGGRRGRARASSLVLLFLGLALPAFGGCARVQPWERDLLADPRMVPDRESVDSGLDDHIYFSKEASSGGRGFGGGGCGCN
jgi:hypothetical protein